MSRDNYIYLSEAEFPRNTLTEILSSFGVEEKGEEKWVLDSGDGSVWVDVVRLSENHAKSEKYNWRIGIHFQSPYEIKKLWLTYAFPYQCLVLMNGAVYQSGDSEYTTREANEFEKFANRDILKFTSLQKLHKNGLLNENELLDINT